MSTRIFTVLILSAGVALTGCSAFRSYDDELLATNQQLRAGNIEGALHLLEKNNSDDNKDLLYYLEKGELLRAKGDLIGSLNAWRSADKVIRTWEDSTRLDTDKYLSQFASYAVNDKVRRYEGHDYEKVMLSTQIALNMLARNDFEGARTEIKKPMSAKPLSLSCETSSTSSANRKQSVGEYEPGSGIYKAIRSTISTLQMCWNSKTAIKAPLVTTSRASYTRLWVKEVLPRQVIARPLSCDPIRLYLNRVCSISTHPKSGTLTARF